MISTQTNIDTRLRSGSLGHRPKKRPPSEDALAGIAALGQTVDTIRSSRFKWFAIREAPLAALGDVADACGDAVAREVAELVLQRVKEGVVSTSREARGAIMQIAARFDTEARA
jgi:hypothetical protein